MNRVVALALTLASLTPACGDSSSSGGTFECGGTSVASRPQCQLTSQYCEVTTVSGASTAACRDLPAGCPTTESPCSCISAAVRDGGGSTTSCVSVSIGGARQTTVSR